jgi:hypothetical protein
VSHHTLRVINQTASGSRISVTLLRDLLAMVAEGSRRALRMRLEGHGSATGRPPDWLEPATTFDFVGLSEGSSVVNLEAPTLAESVPETFSQACLFLDHTQTAIGLWHESLADAVGGKADSELYDKSMLAEFRKSLARVFSHDIDAFELCNGKTTIRPLVVRRNGISQIEFLRSQIAHSRRVRVAGKLDELRRPDCRLSLILSDGSILICWTDKIEEDRLRTLWGRPVVVSGLAVFRPSGKVLRIEVDQIRPASDADLQIWSVEPEPLQARLDVKALRKSQGPRSGINAIFGMWPGDETDEEFEALLRETS